MSEDVFDSTAAVEEFRDLMRSPDARQAFVEMKAQHAASGVQTRYRHILQVVGATPWAIRPDMLGLIVDLLAFRAAGGRLSAEEIAQRVDAARRAPAPMGSGGVAVVPLHGVIVPRANSMSEMSGGTSIEGFRAMFREAMASDKVKALVIDVDSPGGMVGGVPEMAAEIRAARGVKPIVAVANTEAASAAYWLAAQAASLVVSKSARVGSVGVFTAHEDQSQKDANEGMKTTLISAGRYKTEGNPFEPLSEEARANTQKLVDSFYGMFVSDLAKGRGVTVDSVRQGFGEGRMVGAADAVAQGMADRIGTTEDVVRSLLSDTPLGVAALSQSDVNRTEAALLGGTGFMGTRISVSGTPGDAFVLEPSVVAAVDNSAWDGNKAMTACSTAAEYDSICAGEHGAGTPDQRQHWALPHHYLGKGPNAEGTRQALSRLPQTQDLSNRGKAQAHLDNHMREISPGASATAEPAEHAGVDPSAIALSEAELFLSTRRKR